MQAPTRLMNVYDSFNEACDEVINFLKKHKKYQFDILVTFEGRSFKVITERGKMINSNFFDEEDYVSRREFGEFERKVKVYAAAEDDMKPIADKFCLAFGTDLVTVAKEITQEE